MFTSTLSAAGSCFDRLLIVAGDMDIDIDIHPIVLGRRVCRWLMHAR
jgi:hypothetical protein